MADVRNISSITNSTKTNQNHKNTKTNQRKKLTVILITITLLAFITSQIPTFAAATLSIIQQKEDTSAPLKKFLYTGETIDYDLLLNNKAIGSSTKVTWTLSNPALATITNEGVLTANAKGTLKITAKYKKGTDTATASYTLQIKQKVTEITLTDTWLTLETGETATITATPLPATADDIGRGISWTSADPAIATIDPAGNITAQAAGTTTLTASFLNEAVLLNGRGASQNQYIKKSCTITVTEILPSRLHLIPEDIACYVGETKQLTAIIEPANATNKTITWESADPAIATITRTGKVTAQAAGTTTLTAKTATGNRIATCTLEAEDFPFGEIQLETDNLTLYTGKTEQLRVPYTPADISWEIADPEIAQIEAFETTGPDDRKSGWCQIKGLEKGETTLTATATHNGDPITKTCRISIKNIPLRELKFPAPKQTLYTGESLTMPAVPQPWDATITGEITYRSTDETIATIDETGTIHALKTNTDETGEILGDCHMIATATSEDDDGNPLPFFAKCELKVLDINPEAIDLTPRTLAMEAGGAPATLTAQIRPENTTNKEILYHSENSAIATVSEEGTVTPISAGTTKVSAISAADPAITADSTITITPAWTEDIHIKEDQLKIGVGHTSYIQVLSAPGDITFTSQNPDIAETDQNGYLTGIAKGTTTITLTARDERNGRTVTKECHIKVIRYIEEIQLDKEKYTLNTPTGQLPVTATILPEDADEKTLEWTTSDPTIATVDQTGLITPQGYGSATITARATDGSDISRQLSIDVFVPPTGIELRTDQREQILYIDGGTADTIRLEAVIHSQSATNKKIKWKASGDAVSLQTEGADNQYCHITARKAAEEIIITASDARETVTVSFKIIVRVKVNAVQAQVAPGQNYTEGDPITLINTIENKIQLKAKILPEDATNQAVTWESLSPLVAIDSQGIITIAKDTPIGIYSIRVTTEDGARTAIKRLKVNQGVKKVYLIPVNLKGSYDEQHAIMEGTHLDLIPEIYPFNAYNKNLTLASDNPEIATPEYSPDRTRIYVQDQTLKYTLVDKPTTIRAAAEDGSGATASWLVWVMLQPC